MRFSDFKYPNVWLAQFNYNKTTSIRNLDFTQCWSMDTELKMDKKIIGNDILQTDYFSENEKDIIASSELNKYKLDNLKIKDNDFTNLNKTIKPTEFAFFLYENLNIIKETFVSELNKKVNLIGGVWYYVKADNADGKIELVTPKDKLKFNIKQDISLSELSLLIAPVIASQKLNLRKRKINNLLIISTFSKNRKRKMKDIIETMALRHYKNLKIIWF